MGMDALAEREQIDIDSLWASFLADRNVKARNAIAEYYLPLVKIVAGRIAISLPAHVDREDVLSSGFFGLMEAIERYDPERQNKFETYAGVRVRGAMLDYLRSRDWIPVALRQKIRRYEAKVAELEGKLGRPAEDEELADALSMTIVELKQLESQASVATVMPLDDMLQADSIEQEGDGPSQQLEKKEIKETLAAAIERLPEKEKKVVALYYYEELTLKEIASLMHLSEARISQLHTKAVFRMRGYLSRMKASLL